MPGTAFRTRVIVVLLGLGAMSPVLYFGAQLVCGLMTDGYSFMRNAASDLGTSDRPYHAVFNAAALATGACLLCGGVGLLMTGLRPVRRRAGSVIVGVCCLSAGAAAFAAGIYPLPDARHGGGAIGAGMFVAPFAVAFALRDRTRLRALLGLNIAVFAAGGVILASGSPAIAGFGQRLLAAAVFPALAFVCAQQLRDHQRRYVANTGVP